MSLKRIILIAVAVLTCAGAVFVTRGLIHWHNEGVQQKRFEKADNEGCLEVPEWPAKIKVDGHTYLCNAEGHAVEEVPYRRAK